MHEPEQLEQNVSNLLGQIKRAMDPQDSDEPLQPSTELLESSVSQQELRDELERLKDQQLGKPHQVTAAGEDRLAMVPAAVPALPSGVLVTESMKKILSNLVTEDMTRIGFLVSSLSILVGAPRCFEN
jgi:hypothetical protein